MKDQTQRLCGLLLHLRDRLSNAGLMSGDEWNKVAEAVDSARLTGEQQAGLTPGLSSRLFNAVVNGVAFREGDVQFGPNGSAWLPAERIVPAGLLDEVQAATANQPGPEPVPAEVLSPFETLARAELEVARSHGHGYASFHEAYAVLLEEVGEFFDEVRKKRSQRDRAAMLTELVQIAAVCRKAAESLGLCNR